MKATPARILLGALATLVFGVLAVAVVLFVRLSQGPINLELVRPAIERSLTDARRGEPVKLKELVLEWTRDRQRIQIAAREFMTFDRAGNVLSRAERATITLDVPSLLRGKVVTRQMRLENGRAAIRRTRKGEWLLANVSLGEEPARDPERSILDLFADLEWSSVVSPLRTVLGSGNFERVELYRFRIEILDEASGAMWVAQPANAVWSADRLGAALDLELFIEDGFAPGSSTPLRISVAAPAGLSEASAALELKRAPATALARLFGTPQAAAGANIFTDARLTVQASEAEGLSQVEISLSGGSGNLVVAGEPISVSALAAEAIFDPKRRTLELLKLGVASDRLTTEMSGKVNLGLRDQWEFALSTPRIELTATPFFAGPLLLEDLVLAGSVSHGLDRLTIASASARSGDLQAEGSAELTLAGPKSERRVGVKVDAVANGRADVATVLAFWPVDLGKEARKWVTEHVTAGIATRAIFHMDAPPGFFDDEKIEDSELDLQFEAEGAAVKFLDDFPAVSQGRGRGRLKGNSLQIDVAAARFGEWTVSDGRLDLPQFKPKGQTARFTAHGQGNLRDLMRILDRSNLQVGAAYGLDIEGMSGRGGVDALVEWPMKSDIPDDEIRYRFNGRFQDAEIPRLLGDFGLQRTSATVDVDNDRLRLSGAGRFGPAQATFTWVETFGTEKGSSDLMASLVATPDLLNALGVAARNLMQGEADVSLHATGSGRDFASINAEIDFTKAALELSELGWAKRFDTPAKGAFRYAKAANGSAVAAGEIRGDGLLLLGEADLDPAGDLTAATIERIYSRDAMDLRGAVARQKGGYRVSLNGPLFDVSPWMDGWLSPEKKAEGGAAKTGGGRQTVNLQLDVDRLRLRRDADLTSARVLFELGDDGPRRGRVTGEVSEGKAVDFVLDTDSGGRTVSLTSDDAGFGMRVLLKTDYLVGGSLKIDGRFDGDRGTARVVMRDVRLLKAPLLAQLLSLASLRGLSDVLSGEGVLFTQVDAPVRIVGGRLDFPGLRASGPAMGLTARGWVNPEKSEIQLDGVLVPSFGVNSALGGLPIIGDLFVSRKGEGMFAAVYSVRGTFQRARVSINPVAAITPGMLRRMFENPSRPIVLPDDPSAPAPKAGAGN